MMLQEEVELRKMLPEVFYDSNGFCTDGTADGFARK
jgi:hypothetical protein